MMKETKYSHDHGGHRQRLKDKVREFGFEVLNEHELLELILMYSIPFKNTNDIAHALIKEFGSIPGVISADRHNLQRIKGVGKETSLFLNMLNYLYNNNNKIRTIKKFSVIKTTNDMISFFRQNYTIGDTEMFYIIGLDSRGKVCTNYEVAGDKDNVTFDSREFTIRLLDSKVTNVILFHTHPNGIAKPSNEDLETTEALMRISFNLRIAVREHMIMTDYSYYSFRANGLIESLTDKVLNPMPGSVNRAVNTVIRKINEDFADIIVKQDED